VCSAKRVQNLFGFVDSGKAREDFLKRIVMLVGMLSGAGVFYRDEREPETRSLTQGGLDSGIPQAAVNEQQGSYQVAVVEKDSRVVMRPVQVGGRTGTMWVINEGLKPGERVVVEGQLNLRPGMLVQTKPFKGDVE
jgi:hypothetical protein